jgi:hypothetical protein
MKEGVSRQRLLRVVVVCHVGAPLDARPCTTVLTPLTYLELTASDRLSLLLTNIQARPIVMENVRSCLSLINIFPKCNMIVTSRVLI